MRIAEETWLEFILLDIWIGVYLMHIFGLLKNSIGRKSETQTMLPTLSNKQQFFPL